MSNPVKIEITNDSCGICYSLDRKLFALGEYESLYFSLLRIAKVVPSAHFSYSSVVICWQCKATLRRIDNFLKLIANANSCFEFVQSNFKTSLQCALKTDYDFDFKESIDGEVKVELLQHSNISLIKNGTNHQKSDEDHNPNSDLEDTATDEFDSYVNETNGWEDLSSDIKEVPKNDIILPQIHNIKRNKVKANQITYKTDAPFRTVAISLEDYLDLYSKEAERFDATQKYHCHSCLKIFKNKSTLLRHKKVKHNKNNKYLCSGCQVRAPTAEKLKIHWNIHLTGIMCCSCNEVFLGKRSFFRHYNESHDVKWECSKCGETFLSRYKLNCHNKRKHSETKKFECNYCGKAYTYKERIIKHIGWNHTPLECKKCNMTFTKRKTMYNHMNLKHSVTQSKEAAYCVECDLQFANDKQFKKHLYVSRKHNQKTETKFPCEECGKIFTRKSYCKYHYNLVHLKKTKFHCQECDKYFSRADGLRTHIKGVHMGVRLPKTIYCEICGRGFQTNPVLKKHMRIHTGERPYACDMCPATFTQKYPRDHHMKNVHAKHDRESQDLASLAAISTVFVFGQNS